MTNSRVVTALRSTNAARVVAAAFAVSGVVHLARPQVFRPLIPPQLPEPDVWIYSSGVAELVCAAGLAADQRWARPASVALLLAVWPGNATYAVKVSRKRGIGSRASLIGWARMPLQIPMIVAVWPREKA